MLKINSIKYCIVFIEIGILCPCFAQQDGTLDISFGTNGVVIEDITQQSAGDRAMCVAIQADDKIVLGGFLHNVLLNKTVFSIVRFNPNGIIDSTFGTNGLSTTSFGGDNFGYSLAIQPDQRILLAGYSQQFGFEMSVARYNPDGSLDTTLSGTGMLHAQGGYLHKVLLDSTNNILLAGFGGGLIPGSTQDIVIKKFNPFGVADTSFGVNGVVIDDLGSNESIYTGAIQADGRIIVAGRRSSNGLVVRYNTDGSIDTTFKSIGYTEVDFGGWLDVILSLAIQPNGQILLAGDTYNGAGTNLAIARLHQNGNMDSSFGVNGIIIEDFGGIDIGYAICIQNDGKVLVAGSGTSSEDFIVARYLYNGAADSTFGSNGKAIIDLGNEDFGRGMAIQADGKIVVAGYTEGANGIDDNFAMIRLHNLLSSVQEVNNNTIIVYPNPANDYLKWDLNENIIKIEFINMLGNIVSAHPNIYQNELDISHLPAGVYFVKFFTSDYAVAKIIALY